MNDPSVKSLPSTTMTTGIIIGAGAIFSGMAVMPRPVQGVTAPVTIIPSSVPIIGHHGAIIIAT